MDLSILLLTLTAAPAPPVGIYGLSNTHNWVLVNGQRTDLHPLSPDGLTSYANWNGIEPERGQDNWHGLRRLLTEARAAGKRMAYGILTGDHTPDWALQLHGTIVWEHARGRKAGLRSPLPWVEQGGRRVLNQQLLDAWAETVKAFAAELRGYDDYRELIAYVPITGAPQGNGLEVMWGVDNPDDFTRLSWGEAEDALLVQYWERCVDIFLDTLPELPLGLAVTDYFGKLPDGSTRRSYTIPKQILDYALARATEHDATVMPMGLWAGIPGLQKPDHPLPKLLFSYADRAPIGLQGQMGTPTADGVNAMLKFGYDAGASWFEVRHHDLVRPEYQPLLREWSQRYHAR